MPKAIAMPLGSTNDNLQLSTKVGTMVGHTVLADPTTPSTGVLVGIRSHEYDPLLRSVSFQQTQRRPSFRLWNSLCLWHLAFLTNPGWRSARRTALRWLLMAG
jgi:hypothetical protein